MREAPATGSLQAMIGSAKRLMADSGVGDLAGVPVGVALSGGADSVALLLIMKRLGAKVTALHCNFHLRGEESDRDERHARETANTLGVGIEVCHFDVAQRKQLTGESTEMACRELRYNWFAKMRESLGLKWIALGHHRDDNIETMLLSMLRGTGLKGIAAIRPRRGFYIRPLLECTKNDILLLLKQEGITYVTDSSNLTNDYTRNRLRNIVVPAITEEFPDAAEAIAATLSNLNADRSLFEKLISQKRARYTLPDGRVEVKRLTEEEPEAATLLFHLLGDFNAETAASIVKGVNASGTYFLDNKRNRYLLDRGILTPLSTTDAADPGEEYTLSLPHLSAGEKTVVWESADRTESITATLVSIENFSPKRDPDSLWVDSRILSTEANGAAACHLTLRHPRKGDRIKPFGMKGSKLLSDIFSDAKVPDSEKPSKWVLTHDKEILWVVGLRSSRSFTVEANTEAVIHFQYLKC